MSSEKIAAFHESWQAMSMALWRTQLQFATQPWRWWGWAWLTPAQRSRRAARYAMRAGNATAAAGLAPVARRVHANVRRLARPSAR